jgi:hypothetical protein
MQARQRQLSGGFFVRSRVLATSAAQSLQEKASWPRAPVPF